nr:hemerythrin domain-containing protein [Piscinibacter sakaiensis]
MLAACHGRIERHLDLIERLAGHLARAGADASARDAAAQLLRYFGTAVPLHHADEEQDLFPALHEAVAGSDAVCLRALTEGLATQHRRLDAAWEALRPVLRRLADGAPFDAAADWPADAAAAFLAANHEHLAREDGELLPMAARLLDAAALAAIGRAMRERRGIPAV